jgi:hypothetical protein
MSRRARWIISTGALSALIRSGHKTLIEKSELRLGEAALRSEQFGPAAISIAA